MLAESVFETYGALMTKVGWVGVEDFFYRAMLGGWASGDEPRIDSERGTRRFEGFVDDALGLQRTEEWTKTRGSDWGSGVTTIRMLVLQRTM